MVFFLFKKKKCDEYCDKRRPRPTFRGVITAFFATQAAICLLLIAGLSLAGTAVAFIATMPLFVLFSPVLVPAGITTGLLATGLAASGGADAIALKIIMMIFKKLTGKDFPKIPELTPPAGAPAAGAPPAGAPPAADKPAGPAGAAKSAAKKLAGKKPDAKPSK